MRFNLKRERELLHSAFRWLDNEAKAVCACEVTPVDETSESVHEELDAIDQALCELFSNSPPRAC